MHPAVSIKFGKVGFKFKQTRLNAWGNNEKRRGACGPKLSENKETFPNCGDKNSISVTLQNNIKALDQIKGGVKGKGSKRAKMEFKVGWEIFRKTAEWRYIERFIDRIKNLYKEVVKDKDGTIIKECCEPLKNHKGHGDAKRKKS
ncbi:MAG: zinc ribbon domain-containing protein [Caldiserica bacterium]|jgi:hypothetical protein|nr:zinc ribbon domain-containing protein [Caldisericota bacterium]